MTAKGTTVKGLKGDGHFFHKYNLKGLEYENQ